MERRPSILKLSLKIGQAVQIGPDVCVRVEDKAGRSVRLAIATSLSPITIIPSGLFPEKFTMGITSKPEPRIHVAAF